MRKKSFYTIVVLLSFLAAGIKPALADTWVLPPSEGVTYPFGTWDPGSSTFTLTRNLDVGDLIQIGQNNMTLNGAGYTVTPSSTDAGVDLYERSGVTIKNLNVTGGGTGISLRISNSCTVTDNTVSACDYGIWLAGSSNNEITDNTADLSENAGIWLQEGFEGPLWVGSDNNTLTSNTVTGVSIAGGIGIYIQLCIDNILSSNTVSNYEDGIRLSHSYSNIDRGNTLTTNNISNNYWGIHLYCSNNNSLTGNNVTDNAGGIWLDTSCYENNLTNNTVLRNGPGIYLRYSSNNNTLTGNNSSDNDTGFLLLESSENTLEYNTASNNEYGIKLVDSNNNILTNNTVSGNTLYGIWLDPSNNNQIYNNNFIDNATQAWADSDSTDNLFNLALPIGGNYWSGWTGPDPYVIVPPDVLQDEFPWATQDGWLPVANAGADQTVECACQTPEGTKVTLDGAGSTGTSTYTWFGPFEGSPVSGATPTVTLNVCLGEHEVTLVINEGEPDSDTDTVIITVVDTTPPDVSHPGDVTIEAMGPDGVPKEDDRIQAFLNGAAATDNCDPEPTITNDAPAVFPPGDTIVIFTATDESGNTSTCQATVTVVEAAEGHLRIIPKIINREGRLEKILAVIRFPEGVTEEDIDIDQPLILYPGDSLEGIEAISQRIVTWYRWGTLRISVFASFSKDEVTAGVPEDGPVEKMVIGRFMDGQYFFGLDTVRIISWDWPCW